MKQFSDLMGKGYSTVAKYETGMIAVDLETLLKISDILSIPVDVLCNQHAQQKSGASLQKVPPEVYVYDYYRKTDTVVSSVINHYADENSEKIRATMYFDADVHNKTDCEFYFEGECVYGEFTINYFLKNTLNPIDYLHLLTVQTLKKSPYSVGMMMGLKSTPFSIVSSKYIMTNRILTPAELQEIRPYLEIDKETMQNIKKENHFRYPATL